MSDFRPIETAPRDGTLVQVMAEGFGPFTMRWNPQGVNDLTIGTSGQPGLWETANPEMATWTEGGDCGPTHWRPIPLGVKGGMGPSQITVCKRP